MDDDDFGPPIAECPNLGSFAEDSPPRRRSSPQYYASYRQSPPYYYYPSYEAWASPEYRRPSSPPNKKRRWNDESPFRSPVATEKGSNKVRVDPPPHPKESTRLTQDSLSLLHCSFGGHRYGVEVEHLALACLVVSE